MSDEAMIRAAVREGVRAELDAREARDREAARREGRSQMLPTLLVLCSAPGLILGVALDAALWGTSFMDAPSYPWGRAVFVALLGASSAWLGGRWLGLFDDPEADAGPRAGAGEGCDG